MCKSLNVIKTVSMFIPPTAPGQEGSQGARGGVDAGGVINLSSEDADSIMTFFMHCHYIWAIPLKVRGHYSYVYFFFFGLNVP